MPVYEVPIVELAAAALHDAAATDPVALPAMDVDSIRKLFTDLLGLNIDIRWFYLAEQGYSEADLNVLSATMAEWLAPDSEPRLPTMGVDGEYNSPFALLKSWLGTTDIRRLFDTMAQHPFPNIQPAICFALVDTMEIAQATIRIAEMRREIAGRDPEDWTTGDPEDFEEDMMWAEAGFDEEVASWPAY